MIVDHDDGGDDGDDDGDDDDDDDVTDCHDQGQGAPLINWPVQLPASLWLILTDCPFIFNIIPHLYQLFLITTFSHML